MCLAPGYQLPVENEHRILGFWFIWREALRSLLKGGLQLMLLQAGYFTQYLS